MTKEQLIDFERINVLLVFYKELLTVSQQEIMESYYAYNLSLSEISEEKGISRTAVQDCLKKSNAKLEHYESCLQLAKKDKLLKEILEESKNATDKTLLAFVEKIEKVIN